MDYEEFEYKNGVRLFQLEHEKSQFERMLDRYTAKAKHHFTVKMSKTLTQEERDVKLREALRELEHERRHLETMAVIQAELDAYREAGLRVKSGTAIERKSALNMMAAEKHHGTETLEKYMRAEGVPKPSSLLKNLPFLAIIYLVREIFSTEDLSEIFIKCEPE